MNLTINVCPNHLIPGKQWLLSSGMFLLNKFNSSFTKANIRKNLFEKDVDFSGEQIFT